MPGPRLAAPKATDSVLRQARLRAGLSLTKLAARADVSVPILLYAERAPFLATARTIERVAAALGVPEESLREGEHR